MRNHTTEEKYKVTIRVNRDLLEEIRKLARHDCRTVNSYINSQMRLLADTAKAANKRSK